MNEIIHDTDADLFEGLPLWFDRLPSQAEGEPI